MPNDSKYDVIVAGAGPAGSSAAALIAREGHRVLLLDREQFPRFRIGESLMPATYSTLQRLGVLDKMKRSFFPKKYSVQFFSPGGRSGVPFYFDEVNDDESAQTWQVDRAEFDQMLLDNAREAGVEVRLGANVKDVLLEDGKATGVRVDFGGDRREEISSRVIVDATGQTALIARKLGLKDPDPKLKNASFYSRYRGAKMDEGKDAGATLIFRTANARTWFWFIPLPDGEVSVGVVAPIDHLLKGREGSPQEVFAEELAACPALTERLAGAKQTMEVGAMRDFSYISKKIAGDGWVMAGDAFGFLDPIYSSGVFLALQSGEMAADAVNAGLRDGDLSEAKLGRFGREYVEGMEAMRKLVYAYYDDDFSFARFLERYPQYRDGLVNLLVGNVHRRSFDEMFESMAEMCPLPESRRLDEADLPRAADSGA